MSEEKTVYLREYDDSENIFVKENKDSFDDSNIEFVKVPSRRSMRNLIVKKCIEFSEKYHISISIKEDEHFLFVAFGFGKYMYLDFLKPLLFACEDVFIVHEQDRTILELLFCVDDMTVKE